MVNSRSLLFVFCLCYIPTVLFALHSNPVSPEHKENQYSEKKTKNAQSFYFGTQIKSKKGIALTTAVTYTPETGYGFDFNTASNIQMGATAFSAEKPTYFSVKLPEGNYKVKVTMGSDTEATMVTLKAESRRLLLGEFPVEKGKQLTKTFAVNVRTPKIDATSQISLKERDFGLLNWDDKLTLEFLGKVSIQKIEIIPVSNLTTVFLAGDSTVTDQDLEPWASWGQFITNYFDEHVVVANYAVSGASLSSFKASGRLKKILSLIKPGDYLMVEFAHNDEKIKGEENGPWRSYSDLLTEFVLSARKKGAIAILVTPTQRRAFIADGTLKPTHGDFPDAMRAVAKKNNVPLIDVTQMTTQMYESWGDEPSRKAFVQYPANTFPGQTNALEDNTHFNGFGANEIALCVIEGLRGLDVPLKKNITKQTPSYNPNKPNAFSTWTLPMSVRFEIVKPDGN